MTEKSILITGCSSGIGLDAAITLKQRGWRVFATCRSEEDSAALRKDGFESFVLDYEDEASIERAVEAVLAATGGSLDALFNNGAYAVPGLVEDIPRDAFRTIFEANLFGYFDLIQRLMPTFHAQGHGRIVNCSSVLGIGAMPFRGAYNATKFALEGLTDTMRLELMGSNIQISLIEPGPIPTKFRENAAKQFEKWVDWEKSHHAEMYRTKLLKRLYDDKGKPDPFELPASECTKALIHAIEAPRPKSRYYVTKATWMVAYAKRALPAVITDRLFAKF